MPQQRPIFAELPDFLQKSPYIPFSSGNDGFYKRLDVREKPSIREILRSRRSRTIVFWGSLILFSLYLIHNIDPVGRFTGSTCLRQPAVIPPSGPFDNSVDWSKFAYVQYVTSTEYLCNSVLLFETLHRAGSQADRLLLYPEYYDTEFNSVRDRLLAKASDQYDVKLVPVQVQHNHLAVHIWADSYTKLLAFNQTQYERLLVLDSDGMILQHMDELFLTPPTTVSAPRAYWLEKPTLASHIMLITPSKTEFSRVAKQIKNAGTGVYDMEIINKLYGKTCTVLPHRQYALLSGDFRNREWWPKGHLHYVDESVSNPEIVIQEAKYVHFSDFPLAKPWEATAQEIQSYQPSCYFDRMGAKDCRARHIWLNLYSMYKDKTKAICGIDYDYMSQSGRKIL